MVSGGDWAGVLVNALQGHWSFPGVSPSLQACGPVAAGLLLLVVITGACCCGIGLVIGLVAGPACRWFGIRWIRQAVAEIGPLDLDRVFVGNRQRRLA